MLKSAWVIESLKSGDVHFDAKIPANLAERLELHKNAVEADPTRKAKFEKRHTREAYEARLAEWERTFKS
jgi:hypothetical protein